MKKPERPQQLSRKPPPKQTRQTLAAAVGGLPLPSRLPKLPSPTVHKPMSVAAPKPSASKPHPPKGAEHAPSGNVRPSFAGRLGAFKLGKAQPGSSSKKRR
jgi:hypothetical protein